MEWTTALPDWEQRIVAGQPMVAVPALFPAEAQAALAVFDRLVVADVSGRPCMGDLARPWVRAFVAALFGAYDPATGRRLIREALLLISKKNSKSTLAAAIVMTLLVRNWRDSAELLILAPTIEVAENSFQPAWNMVRHDEELGDLLHVQPHRRTIRHRTTHAELKIVAADSDTVSGTKAGIVIVDELWAFGKKPEASSMLTEATGGLTSRPEGIVIYTSTHSDEPPAGVFKEKLEYARAVRDGKVHDRAFLPVLYEFPPHMLATEAWREEKHWAITNPNMGASVDEETLRRKWQQALVSTEGKKAVQIFVAKHLNVEAGTGQRSDGWAGSEFWDASADPTLTLDEVLERSEVLTVGIDGGGLEDLLGMAVLGRERGTGRWLLWNRAWAHPSVLVRRKAIAPKLLDFQAKGELKIVLRPGEDVQELVGIVARLEETGLLDQVGVDQHGIGAILDGLEAAGVASNRIVGISQGWRLVGAIKTAERRLADGTLVHGGMGLMSSAVSSAKVEPRGNAIVITKQGSGGAKIDPLMASFNAVELMSRNPQAKNAESVFFV